MAKTFPMLRAEQINLKPSINLSLHVDSTGDALHAGSMGDIRFSSGWGILDKSILEINSTIKFSSSWMAMRMDLLIKVLSKT